MELGIGLVYVAWYSFVFAMCYFFSPWFFLLVFLTPQYKSGDNSKSEESKSDKPQ